MTATWYGLTAEALRCVFHIFLAPHQVRQVADMAERFPGVNVVIDHLAMIDIYPNLDAQSLQNAADAVPRCVAVPAAVVRPRWRPANGLGQLLRVRHHQGDDSVPERRGQGMDNGANRAKHLSIRLIPVNNPCWRDSAIPDGPSGFFAALWIHMIN